MYKQQQHSKRLKDTLIYIRLWNLLRVVNILRETRAKEIFIVPSRAQCAPTMPIYIKKLFWFICVSDLF